ncbi:tyrosine-type recombinase/integrase [Acidisphaera rubrifaciens]|nr:site-specific integrase [Acidisphaera rubrifaciens]
MGAKASKDEGLTDADVKALAPPEAGNRIVYDAEVKGFGVRITKAGARAFILNYRAAGRERRITIGSWPDWKVRPARDHAKALKRRIDLGDDPMGDRHADRAAPTIADLADRFEAEHLPKRRPATVVDYRSILRLYVRPQLGKVRVADLRHSDVEKLHREVAKTAPIRANRTVAVLSKMLALAVKWEMRTDNPARGIERQPENKRERHLTPAELARLSDALAKHPERVSCDAIRLLLLTGARKAEVLSATWSQFDLAAGVWTKPAATTKQAKLHRVPLSAPALALLTQMHRGNLRPEDHLFPGQPHRDRKGDLVRGHLAEIKRVWAAICKDAGLAERVAKTTKAGKPVLDAKGQPVMVWQSTVRIHDLRHTFASILASSGLSLVVIGALLGHTQASTTARYAHLLDDPLRAATERVGAVVTGGGRSAEVVQISGRRA